VLTPRRLLPDVPPPAGLSPRDIAVLQRQQEAALQRVLEEEILKEMNRENMLQAVSSVSRGRVLKNTAWLLLLVLFGEIQLAGQVAEIRPRLLAAGRRY
jgi:hypothetical protein